MSFRIAGGEDGPGWDDPEKSLESSDIENKSCWVSSTPLEGISTGADRPFPFRSGWDVCVVIQSAWEDTVRDGLEGDELWWGNGLLGSHSVGFIGRGWRVKDEYTMRLMYAGGRRYRCRTDGSLPKAYESS